MLESLPLTASEDFDVNCWDDGGAILREGKKAFLFGGRGVCGDVDGAFTL
jgi:hypothetical protein